MLRDKDVDGVVAAMKSRIAHWFVAGLGGPRGADAGRLQRALASAGVDAVTACDDVAAGYAQACGRAGENDRIVVFGSFYTVATVMQLRASGAGGTGRGN
jgi:dihydrofolate synthase/folylpolyglutamate synthase